MTLLRHEVDYWARMINVHKPTTACFERACVVHNPSDHHMRPWPLQAMHAVAQGFQVRVCVHSYAHPDPDSLAYFESVGRLPAFYKHHPHACDGCCAPPPSLTHRPKRHHHLRAKQPVRIP